MAESFKPSKFEKPTTVTPGDLLLAKVPLWPWWPVFVVAIDETPEDVIAEFQNKKQRSDECYYVQFLHEFDFYCVPVSQLRVFDPPKVQAGLETIGRVDVRAAMRLALDPGRALSLHRENIATEKDRRSGKLLDDQYKAWMAKEDEERKIREAFEEEDLAKLREKTATGPKEQQPPKKSQPAKRTTRQRKNPKEAPEEEKQGQSENETQQEGNQVQEQTEGRRKRQPRNKKVEGNSSSTTTSTRQLKKKPAQSTRQIQAIKHEGETVVEQSTSLKQDDGGDINTVDNSLAPPEQQQPAEESQQSTQTDLPSQPTPQESQGCLEPELTEQPQPTSMQPVDKETEQRPPAEHVTLPPASATTPAQQPTQHQEGQHIQHPAPASEFLENLPQEPTHQHPLQEQQQNKQRRSQRNPASPEKSESSTRSQRQRSDTSANCATKREVADTQDDTEKPKKKRMRRSTNDDNDDNDEQMKEADNTPQQEQQQQQPERGQSPTDVAVVPLSPGQQKSQMPAAEPNQQQQEPTNDSNAVIIDHDDANNSQIIKGKQEAMQIDEEIQTPVPTATMSTNENDMVVIESSPQQQESAIVVPDGNDDAAATTTTINADERLLEEQRFKRAIMIKYRLQTLVEKHRPGKWPVKENQFMRVVINDIRKAQLSKNTVQLLHLRHWVSLASKYTFSKDKDIVFDYKGELASILSSWDSY